MSEKSCPTILLWFITVWQKCNFRSLIGQIQSLRFIDGFRDQVHEIQFLFYAKDGSMQGKDYTKLYNQPLQECHLSAAAKLCPELLESRILFSSLLFSFLA